MSNVEAFLRLSIGDDHDIIEVSWEDAKDLYTKLKTIFEGTNVTIPWYTKPGIQRPFPEVPNTEKYVVTC